MAAASSVPVVPDDDDEDFGEPMQGPTLPHPLQPPAAVPGNPWPAHSPVSNDHVTALLHQLGNTTALLSQVIDQRSHDSSVSGLSGKDMSRIMPRPEPFRAGRGSRSIRLGPPGFGLWSSTLGSWTQSSLKNLIC